MAQITINKDTETQFQLYVDRVNEDFNTPTFTGNATYYLQPGQDAPTVPELITMDVDTLEVVSDSGAIIPVVKTYNKVQSYSTEFSDNPARFSVYISIIQEVE